uniref:Very-long-chain (3R)-3-hydroxyacyl-CoA dehydratase n=1 Tax=Haemonchus contortus TaxID=6289 RepID=W6NDC9_HAECO
MGKPAKRSSLLSAYIFLYNVALFAIHLKIFLDLVNAVTSGKFVYKDHFPLFCIGTAAQLLDVVHGVLGITTTGIAAGLLQVLGRLFMLFLIEGNPTIHNQISTPVLLFAWVLIELFRYPYYALRAWDIEVYALAWLRYTAWIPLYPLGLTMEWLSMVTSLKYYYETGKYSILLPYLDLTLNFSAIIAIIAFAVFPFISRKLLGHMRKQRRNKMNVKKTK